MVRHRPSLACSPCAENSLFKRAFSAGGQTSGLCRHPWRSEARRRHCWGISQLAHGVGVEKAYDLDPVVALRSETTTGRCCGHAVYPRRRFGGAGVPREVKVETPDTHACDSLALLSLRPGV